MFTLASCEKTRVWEKADAFESTLRCGMTETEVSTIVTSFGGPVPREYSDHDGIQERVLLVDGTGFSLFFSSGGSRITSAGNTKGSLV